MKYAPPFKRTAAIDNLCMEIAETVIRDRQAGYYAALAQSNAAGTCDAFVEFIPRYQR